MGRVCGLFFFRRLFEGETRGGAKKKEGAGNVREHSEFWGNCGEFSALFFSFKAVVKKKIGKKLV